MRETLIPVAHTVEESSTAIQGLALGTTAVRCNMETFRKLEQWVIKIWRGVHSWYIV